DVTNDVPFLIGTALVDATQSSVLRVTAATMSGLFIVLLIVVVVADVAISRSKRMSEKSFHDVLASLRSISRTIPP
ncbi:MAG TPA: hypothetical protein VFA32_09455, partial [Dehalococcoidia bacterium]|nr:hypothetical protein [Dehalococcoidia bacterium]